LIEQIAKLNPEASFNPLATASLIGLIVAPGKAPAECDRYASTAPRAPQRLLPFERNGLKKRTNHFPTKATLQRPDMKGLLFPQ
jgi:hypothetical protein